jgi:hypothetical protein
MANEATVTASLRITKGNVKHQSVVRQFSDNVSGTDGPTPGAIAVTTAGVDVDLSGLTTPGWCEIRNLDATNFVTYGIWDPEGAKFYPLGELSPGHQVVLKLSRDIEEEFGTGSGTTGANTNRLRIKADTASCNVFVGAFEA